MRAPVRKGSEELPTTITRSPGDLVTASGYWSGRPVYRNISSDIVLLKPDLTPADFIEITRNAYLQNLRNGIVQRLRYCRKNSALPLCEFMREAPVFRNTFSPSRLQKFAGREFIGAFGRKSWVPISRWLEVNFETEADRESYLIDAIHHSMIDGEGAMINVHRLNVSFLHFGMPLFSAALASLHSVDETLNALGTIRQFSWNYFKYDAHWAHEYNGRCIRVFENLGLPFARMENAQHAQWALGFSNAANLFLAYCVKEDLLLLPPHYTNLVSSCRLTAPEWPWDELPPLTTQLLQTVVCSTTLKSIEDLPSNPHDWLSGVKGQSNMQRVFAKPIELYARRNPACTPWPLANLHRGKQMMRRRLDDKVEVQLAIDCGPAWEEFSKIYESASEVGPSDRNRVLRVLLPWAASRGFTSPNHITSLDLYDPFNPFSEGSFKSYLEKNVMESPRGHSPSLAPTWNAVARSFLLVCNYLKIAPSKVLQIPSNPFEPHEVPFEQGRRNKTVRRRLPTEIIEAMTEILMEPDEEGRPTYKWAMQVFPDHFESFDPISGKTEKILSPSRCGALALLLCLPFRGKQVRWLDRGLMDTMRWDGEQGKMVVNEHPLTNFQYADGHTHEVRYGRPSGVIQIMSDSIRTEEQHIGIFVNTNKTAMWNPENRRGYEVPWPVLEKSEATRKDSNSWISRPYEIIKAQLAWMDKHLPTPIPVSLADSASERHRIHERYLDRIPAFCPLFADLSARSYRNNAEHTLLFLPVSSAKIYRLFNALCVETERRFAEEGRSISITRPDKSDASYMGRIAIFDIHSLRVSGISRLLELGVPVSIVQEFIVGHATAVMTIYYEKIFSSAARQEIAAALERDGRAGDWRDHRELLSRRPALWVINGRWAKHRAPGQMEDFVCWKAVPGGICPVGGVGCDEGGVLDDEVAIGREVFIPVVGGCGNCRYFSTGPAFLIQQSQALNEIMLELRLHGKNRGVLIEKRSELAWADTKDLDQVQRDLLIKKLADIQEAISDVDVKIEPLILEWINRLRMFEESREKMNSWDEIVAERSEPNALPVNGLDGRLPVEVDIRLERAGEFSLVQNILQGADIRGGLHHASALSKDKCAAFMDRILRSAGARRLLIDITDEKARHEIAYKFATTASALFGSQKVDEHLVSGEPLQSSSEEMGVFVEWAVSLLGSDQANGLPGRALITGVGHADVR